VGNTHTCNQNSWNCGGGSGCDSGLIQARFICTCP
jgi:hypothetical protein